VLNELGLGRPDVVGRRGERLGVVNADEDDCSHSTNVIVARSEQFYAAVVHIAATVNRARSIEAISAAREHVDDIHFDRRIRTQVPYRLWRADVPKEQVLIVIHARRSLWRKAWRAVGVDGCVISEPLRKDELLHVLGSRILMVDLQQRSSRRERLRRSYKIRLIAPDVRGEQVARYPAAVARLENTFRPLRASVRDNETVRKGAKTRQTIVERAAARALERGLDSHLLGALAEELSMSKSGIFAHFGSKEDLQLATIERAREIFVAEVIEPALRAPQGVERLRALCKAWLSYVERDVFPGGCFFSATIPEFAHRPGIIRDRLASFIEQWLKLLEDAIRAARRKHQRKRTVDSRRLAFELFAIGDTASRYHGVLGTNGIKTALQTVHDLIDGAASDLAYVSATADPHTTNQNSMTVLFRSWFCL
jgi:AcrR family transcriptional regulator